MTEHSPTPWAKSAFHAQGLYGNTGEVVIMSGDLRIGTVELQTKPKRGEAYKTECALRDANADFLLRSANAHTPMVQAIRAILLQLSQGKVLERDACVRQAREALAIAEGRTAPSDHS